jgi:hypothetical protein
MAASAAGRTGSAGMATDMDSGTAAMVMAAVADAQPAEMR